jgi:ribonuclease G
MRNEIFVNVTPGETRVAIREADKLVELHIERAAERGVVGGVYKGRVTRVLPGMQAAFVDIGLERAAFLYAGDYRADDEDDELDEDGESGGNGGSRRGRGRGRAAVPQIEQMLQEGQEVIVQVAKEPLGTKGARITSRIALPGRHLVLMPWVSRVGISRRIESDRERRRLRAIVERNRPRELGFIVRTVSHGVSEADIRADIEYLTSRWEQVQRRREEIREAPALLYEEPPLHLKLLRDMATHETRQIVVDDPDAYGEMQEFVQRFMASPRPRIKHYRDNLPLFDAYRVESEIEEGLGRKVWLKSGGYLIFDQGEALTSVDVNTGRYTGGKGRSLEETILKTNLEAVREIVHQLRFRNIGGLIILDLIDMEVHANRDKVYKALVDALREDKSRVNLLKISELGLVEMTRKRTRESLTQQLCEPCPVCEGKSYIQSARTLVFKIFRELPRAAGYLRGETLRIEAHPSAAALLQGECAAGLEKIRARIERKLEIVERPAFHPEQFEISSHGPRVAVLAQRSAEPEELAEEPPAGVVEEGFPGGDGAEPPPGDEAPEAPELADADGVDDGDPLAEELRAESPGDAER